MYIFTIAWGMFALLVTTVVELCLIHPTYDAIEAHWQNSLYAKRPLDEEWNAPFVSDIKVVEAGTTCAQAFDDKDAFHLFGAIFAGKSSDQEFPLVEMPVFAGKRICARKQLMNPYQIRRPNIPEEPC